MLGNRVVVVAQGQSILPITSSKVLECRCELLGVGVGVLGFGWAPGGGQQV